MMMHLSKKRKVIVLIISILFLIIVVYTASVSIFTNASPTQARISASLSTSMTLIFAFIAILPVISDLLSHEEKLTDEQLNNVFEELASAQSLLKSGNYDDAVSKASYVISNLPKKAEAYRIRANAYVKLSKFTSALADYDRAIELEPGYPFVHCQRASLLQRMGEYEKALPDMLKCAAIAVELPSQLYQIGDTLFVMGEFEKAEKVFEQVVNHPNVKSNDKEMANQYLQKIENMRKFRVDFDENDYRVGRRV